ncbi:MULTISPECIES: HAD-IA family hydrolase [unclassified Shewanella]|uniref:HAD family hydrolase n=1 Tax=unclassified Shewanella TaxID=196818 RepID=UPI000C82701E|nr:MULTISPECIES: HAD-IA family hydrolase [unclassified Shewanella]MDO6620095.1 HAD-IA family hydrolase [Shewanella sp. 6_MG-2023]MDO6776182.1 HAD-IA family hydrolase [Shewanella sp. 3_MG-2023]PMG43258.1 HAD family hydrolase [Shewanella sp. 10N.286.52.B9]PMH85541.1 HAD family hydrolase [Shewanella sp. 10N.286.48.B5]
MTMNKIKGVLFDLDGTLADTAPDLVHALNLSLQERGIASKSIDNLRYAASHGSLALVKAGIPELSHELQIEVQQALLVHYQRVNGEKASLFSGFDDFLLLLEQRDIPYGVVTNKQARFTRPLVKALNIEHKLTAIISGDSTQHSKPHTAPMLLAAQQINCLPQDILYIGDAERDLIAARNAGMKGAIALWGYLSEQDKPNEWPSDFQFSKVADLHQAFLNKS